MRKFKDFQTPPLPLQLLLPSHTPLLSVWMESMVDPITLRYFDKLPLLFSPFPPLFSSSASHSLASRQPGGFHQTELSTKCTRCRAEVVGGVNGAYWVERGELWLKCQGCGWATKRIRESRGQEEKGNGKAKEAFESVKKRRKERERREKEAKSHPTQFSSTPMLASTADKAKVPKSASKPTASRSPSIPSIQSTSNSKSNYPLFPPSTSSLPSSLSSISSTTTKTLSSTHSLSTSNQQTPTLSPAPPSLDSKLAASKKRKRSKQPNGLAELLAKKKKVEGESSGSGGDGGLGLQDFLKGL